MLTVPISLTEEEHEALLRIAAEHDAGPGALLAAFAADLTGSYRSGGSDERMLAADWLLRQTCRWLDGELC